jgi:predicted metal-dependent hydrolase
LKKYLKEKLFIESYNILEKYSKDLNIPFNKLSIKDLKSKWGSCSHDNNITINLKLIHLPKDFLKYVTIHEACHLKEKNHSQSFWNLVGKYFPEYKNVRKELKSVNI